MPPSPRRLLGTAGLVGGVPCLMLLLLVLTGEVAAAPGLLALLASGLAALLVAWLWLDNLGRLAGALRRASAEDGRLEAPGISALLPAVDEVADGAARLARTVAEQGALVGRLRLADEAIVENLPDPLLVLSPDRVPLRANAAARSLFGAGADRGPPREGDVAALLRHPTMAAAVERALAEHRPQTADLVLPVPVAREIAAQVIPMEPPLADGGRIVIVLSDRSRERALERMRADFVANASHELRTPLASLIGFIETLRGPAENDATARKRFLGIMAEQSERMRRLIDDLLGLSRIELTEHQPPTGVAPLSAIARAEADALEPLFRARRVSLVTDIAEFGGEPGGWRATGAGGPQPAGERGPPRPRGRRGAVMGGTLRGRATAALAARRAAHRERRRAGHPGRAHSPADRAVLPGGPRAFAQCRRHRAWACHREAHREPAPWPAADRERAGQRCQLPGLAAGRCRACRPAATAAPRRGLNGRRLRRPVVETVPTAILRVYR